MAVEGEFPKVDGDYLYGSDILELLQESFRASSEASLDTIRLQENASLTGTNYNTMFVDLFSDNTGYSDTVNIGSTTALYVSGAHYHSLSNAGSSISEVSDSSSSITLSHSISGTINGGPLGEVTFFSKHTGGGAGSEQVIFFYEDGTSGVNLKAISNSSYAFRQIKADPSKAGSIAQIWTSRAASDGAAVIYTSGVFVGLLDNVQVQTNSQVYTGGSVIDGYYVNSRNFNSGTGIVTYDISFDSGATFQTGKNLREFYNNADAGSEIVLRTILSGASATNYVSMEDYSIVLKD